MILPFSLSATQSAPLSSANAKAWGTANAYGDGLPAVPTKYKNN